jgi:hypothetical protein
MPQTGENILHNDYYVLSARSFCKHVSEDAVPNGANDDVGSIKETMLDVQTGRVPTQCCRSAASLAWAIDSSPSHGRR